MLEIACSTGAFGVPGSGSGVSNPFDELADLIAKRDALCVSLHDQLNSAARDGRGVMLTAERQASDSIEALDRDIRALLLRKAERNV